MERVLVYDCFGNVKILLSNIISVNRHDPYEQKQVLVGLWVPVYALPPGTAAGVLTSHCHQEGEGP